MRGGSVAEKSADVLDRVEREKVGYLADLEESLRIPSISTDPEYKAGVDRCSQWLLERMQRAGLKAERVDAGGHPLVFAEWLGAPRQARGVFLRRPPGPA